MFTYQVPQLLQSLGCKYFLDGTYRWETCSCRQYGSSRCCRSRCRSDKCLACCACRAKSTRVGLQSKHRCGQHQHHHIARHGRAGQQSTAEIIPWSDYISAMVYVRMCPIGRCIPDGLMTKASMLFTGTGIASVELMTSYRLLARLASSLPGSENIAMVVDANKPRCGAILSLSSTGATSTPRRLT